LDLDDLGHGFATANGRSLGKPKLLEPYMVMLLPFYTVMFAASSSNEMHVATLISELML
jgi:hypothetical protein